MKYPKLEVLKYVFNRPTVDGAFSEVVKSYIRYKKEEGSTDPLGELEREIVVIVNDLEAERKQKEESPLRVETAN